MNEGATTAERGSTSELLWLQALSAAAGFLALLLIEQGSVAALASGALVAWCAVSLSLGLGGGWLLQVRRGERPFQQPRV